jgi:membrane protein DedA with SNARE-associated domain
MHHFTALLEQHSYILLFIVVLGEAIGLPVPASLAMVAAGAAAAVGTLRTPAVLGLAITAMLLGDSLLYVLGRYMGWALLALLCRISANPENCILRSAESFYKRGKVTLLIAKFIPGVNSMAPPLAGSMKMRLPQFLRLDLAGTALYLGAYFALGFLFRNFLAMITRGFLAAGHLMEQLLVASVIGYVVYKVVLYRKHKVYRVVPRVLVEELARKLASGDKENLVLLDVRSHGYYDANAMRIKGSLRFEPNHLSEEVKLLPKDKDIYLYCT